jgi:hypothetical protein
VILGISSDFCFKDEKRALIPNCRVMVISGVRGKGRMAYPVD